MNAVRGAALLALTGAIHGGEPMTPWSTGELAAWQTSPRTPATDTLPARDLRNLYRPGFMVADGNGDGVVDRVLGRILVPSTPTPAEAVAAANLAARLGWETTATDLGLVGGDDGRAASATAPLLVVGRAAPPPSTAVQPGEGIIELLSGGRWAGGAAAVGGGDATGVMAAAAYLSSRYPEIWEAGGTAWDEVADRVRARLDTADASPDSVRVAGIVVDAARPGVSRALVRVFYTDDEAYRGAIEALRERVAGRADTAADTTAERRERARRQSLTFEGLRRLDISVERPGAADTIRVRDGRGRDAQPDPAWPTRAAGDFSLSAFYTNDGIFRDTDQDLVPDRTEAFITVDGANAAAALADLSARIALETAGARLPLVALGGQDDAPERHGIPIVFGVDHYHAARLRSDGRLDAGGTRSGEGIIEFVPRGFGERHGIAVTGADAAGLEAAADWLATRAPYLWTWGKGEFRLDEAETAVRRFFQARETPGQAALAAHKLRTWLDRLHGRDIDSLAVELATREAPAGIERHFAGLLRRAFPEATADVRAFATGFGVGDTIFTQDVSLPWEVDTARAILRSDVLPRAGAESRGRIEIRVSEPPAVRTDLAAAIRRDLAGRGVPEDAVDVSVLSAYKQGYSWIEDRVLPRLRELGVASIEIGYHTLRDSDEVRWQAIASETRWLQELYPIDAVLARELGIADSLITFQPRREARPTYTIRALDHSGEVVLADSFDTKYVVRPFFDLFPEYESVRVTTGWITAIVDGDTLADRRIRTDAETFWDILQTDTYRRIVDYVMDIQDGRPSPANAPYFDEFRIDLALSEPDHRIGVDEEVISSLEALHEDIYFETLTLFDLIGGRYGVGSLNHAGRVLPWIRGTTEPGPGSARITFTGKQRGVPELVLVYRERGGEPVRMRYPLSPLPVEPPKLRGVAVRAGEEGLARMLFDVVAVDSTDRFDEVRLRGTEATIDRTLLSASLLEGMVRSLRAMHDDGILRDALSVDRVAEMRLRLVLADDTLREWRRTVDVPRTAAPASTEVPRLLARGWQWNGERIVQWDTPIPPAENDSILARLATFPTANVYRAGRSFLGHDIFAMDLLPPHEARFISQAKLNASKPTVFLSGRQHANEVSSTSHLLRLAELLATDSAYTRLLDAVNVVIHPITNPDGAQLAYEMQLETPDFMLHAGYLGALGVDATAGANSPDPIYPESRVRPELSATWLPDVSLNLHGYPSHEWVQYFAGYSAWVRSRTGAQRSWWAPRGWFIPGFSWVDDPRHPEYREAQFALLDSIAASITADTAIEAMNRRMYARYAKYGRQDVENFREHFHNGILIYSSLRGRDSIGMGVNSPRITWFSATTEAPDETARGEWLDLVASAGLAHTSAVIRYLATGINRVERDATQYQDAVLRTVTRTKPVLPPDGPDAR